MPWMLATVAACAIVATPSARIDEVSLGRLSLEGALLHVDTTLDNPLWVDVHVERLAWRFEVNHAVVAEGARTVPVILKAGVGTPLTVPVEFAHADLLRAVGATFSGHEVPYELRVEIDTFTPRGLVTVPLEYTATLPAIRPPTLDLMDISWQVGEDGRLRIDLALKLGLPRAFRVQRLGWTVDVDHHRVGDGGVEIDEDGALRFPVFFDPRRAAQASWDWLWGEARALELALDGLVQTPLGPAPISMQRAIVLSDHGVPPGTSGELGGAR